MGEIRISQQEFLNELQLWQIRAIIRGYMKSKRDSWIQTRLLAFVFAKIMGCDVDEPETFVKFPWEEETISKKDIEDLKKMVEEAKRKNALNKQKFETTP